MSSLNPLSLPEVRIILSQHLNSKSRKACTLLNKAWHLDIQPSIWEHFCVVTAMERVKTHEDLQWLLASLWTNFVYTRHLRSYGSYHHKSCDKVFPVIMDQVPQLVSVSMRTRSNGHWKSILQVINRNRFTLLYLDLSVDGSIQRYCTDREIHNMFVGLSVLRRLTLDVVDKVTGLIQVLATCPSLIELTVNRQIGWDQYAYYDEGCGEREIDSAGLPQLQSHNLQVLKLRSCNDDNLPTLLAICSKLTTFGMSCGYLSSGDNAKQLASCSFVHLTTLVLDSDYRRHTSIKAVLVALPQHQLQHVTLRAAVDEDVLQVTESHHKSLVDVDITVFSKEWRGHSLASLFSCPLLETITFDNEHAVDIRQITQEPWNCVSLMVLDMPLTLDRSGTKSELISLALEEKEEVAPKLNECDQAEILFMKRLGKMSQLRVFTYTGYLFRGDEPARLFLTWRLSHGLGYLADLSKLESLDLGRGSDRPGIDELEFMRAHWPKLWQLRAHPHRHLYKTIKWLQKNWPSVVMATIRD